MPFSPSTFLIVESLMLAITDSSAACSSLRAIPGSFMTSWLNCQSALGVFLVGWHS